VNIVAGVTDETVGAVGIVTVDEFDEAAELEELIPVTFA
jgi:hypothetical protein